MKHKDNIFIVMRHDFSGQDAVCSATIDSEKADELVGEYTQQFRDRGFTEEECYFYSVATPLYTR